MVQICHFDKCTGCHACMNVCHQDAISMDISSDGFLQPVVDADKCIDCGLCQKVCPVNSGVEKHEPQKVFLAWTLDEAKRANSSSGGIFSALATLTLKEGGVVFGAAYDENMNVCHQFIDTLDSLSRLQGSKYVQSAIGDTYSKVKSFLQDGRKVYFVGTPCQVAGLRSFLRKDFNNLLTSDLVCHGCPSSSLFKCQIDDYKNKYGADVIDLKFRSKKRFGQGYDIELMLSSGEIKYLNPYVTPYFYGFWFNVSLRECCYDCQYATKSRVSDITLADYWAVKKYHKGIKTAKGTSLILANTNKGLESIQQCRDSLVLMEDSIENALKVQGHLSHSVKMPKSHVEWRRECANLSWEQMKKKYFTPNLKFVAKVYLQSIIKTIILYKRWK